MIPFISFFSPSVGGEPSERERGLLQWKWGARPERVIAGFTNYIEGDYT